MSIILLFNSMLVPVDSPFLRKLFYKNGIEIELINVLHCSQTGVKYIQFQTMNRNKSSHGAGNKVCFLLDCLLLAVQREISMTGSLLVTNFLIFTLAQCNTDVYNAQCASGILNSAAMVLDPIELQKHIFVISSLTRPSGPNWFVQLQTFCRRRSCNQTNSSPIFHFIIFNLLSYLTFPFPYFVILIYVYH